MRYFLLINNSIVLFTRYSLVDGLYKPLNKLLSVPDLTCVEQEIKPYLVGKHKAWHGKLLVASILLQRLFIFVGPTLHCFQDATSYWLKVTNVYTTVTYVHCPTENVSSCCCCCMEVSRHTQPLLSHYLVFQVTLRLCFSHDTNAFSVLEVVLLIYLLTNPLMPTVALWIQL